MFRWREISCKWFPNPDRSLRGWSRRAFIRASSILGTKLCGRRRVYILQREKPYSQHIPNNSHRINSARPWEPLISYDILWWCIISWRVQWYLIYNNARTRMRAIESNVLMRRSYPSPHMCKAQAMATAAPAVYEMCPSCSAVWTFTW